MPYSRHRMPILGSPPSKLNISEAPGAILIKMIKDLPPPLSFDLRPDTTPYPMPLDLSQSNLNLNITYQSNLPFNYQILSCQPSS